LKTNASLVAGASAGSAMSLSAIAAITNKTIADSVLITGAVDEEGNMIGAGAIEEKALAAAQDKAELLIIPKSIKTYEEKKVCGAFGEYEYCEVKVIEAEKPFIVSGIKVVQVSNIKEAMPYIFEGGR
ncbi:hypothetical protein HZB88_02340, partial [archaeon]|nr:hypothetical protein [archaeon]